MSLEEAIKKIQILEDKRNELEQKNQNLELENENLKLENNSLKRIVFGSKREKTPENNKEQIEEQCSLFDNPKEIENDLQAQINEKVEEITVYRKKKSKAKKAGIKRAVLKDIVIERKEYIMEENAVCPECKGNLKNVGKKVVRQEIEYEPARLKIKEYIKYVYKCEKCGTEGSKKLSSTFLETEVPKPILTHSFASPSLATEVIYQKYYLGVPLYRQEKMWDDKGKPNTSAYGYIGVTYCNKLFEIEREIEKLNIDEKVKQRQEKSKPVIEEFFKWVNSMMSEKIMINNKLKKALTYASNQQKEISEFLKDGRIPLTNSLAERAIRPFAVHRKNWLFADSVEGANANAVMYSIIESAKINNLNIERYIRYLLEELPQLENITDEKEIERYLPWSKELPPEILNFQGSYEELKVE